MAPSSRRVGRLPPIDATMVVPPPAAPTGLSAFGRTGRVDLTWTASANAASYRVLRRTDTSAFIQISPANQPSGATYTDSSAVNGTRYTYVVKATGAGGDSADSNPAIGTPIAAPTGLVATPGNNKVDLSWTAVPGATGYRVFRSTTNGAFSPSQPPLGTSQTNSYPDNTANNGTPYYYIVRATNNVGESANSNQASATPQPPAPSQPFTITNINNNDVLSGVVNIDVVINDLTISSSNLNLTIGDKYAGSPMPIPVAGNIASNLCSVSVRTEHFANGTGIILKVADTAGVFDSRIINVQNNLSSLRYDSIFDVTPTADDVSHVSRVAATVATGLSWTATIQDDSANVIKTFSGSAPTLDFVWDGKNNSAVAQADGNYLLTITTSNAASLQQMSPSVQMVQKESPETWIRMNTPHKSGWQLTVWGETGTKVRSIKGRGQHVNYKWDGADSKGREIQNGSYTVSVSAMAKQKIRHVGINSPPGGSSTTTVIINKNRIVDSMVLLDETATFAPTPDPNDGDESDPFQQAVTALNYARYIRTMMALKVGVVFDDPANPIVVGLTGGGCSTTSGTCNAGSGEDLAIYNRIEKQFSSKPLKLLYVLSHGNDDFSNPGFKIGQRFYRSKGGNGGVDVRSLVANWNYGESGDPDSVPFDPPKLVWIDACETAGSLSDSQNGEPTGPEWTNTNSGRSRDLDAWGVTFGIDAANGYEGVFLGVSGYGYTLSNNDNDDWRRIRYDFWNALFFENRNVYSAVDRAMTLNPQGYTYNMRPRKRWRLWGTMSTAF